jgi:hypothetical protein
VQAAVSIPGETDEATAYELGWSAELAAAQAGLENPNIVSYRVAVTDHTLTPAQQGMLSGIIRMGVGSVENGGAMGNLGAVPYGTLAAQIRSNITTLASVLPAGTILGSDTVPISVNASTNDYAFEIDLKVNSLVSLQGHVGDVVDGLDTGLTGGPSAPTEGVAINIIDSQGRRVGWWSATRAATGSAIGDPVLPVAGGTETTAFANLTGGPDPTAFASGAEGQAMSAGFALHPTRGIGPVSIGQSQANVAAALGTRARLCAPLCTITYRQRQGILRVTFRRNHVEQIYSTSGHITLGGIPLRAGVHRLGRILHKWGHQLCGGADTYTFGHGPSTTLTFLPNRAVQIDVTSSHPGLCGLP